MVSVHEVFGLTDDIRRVADRFADEGYLALAPRVTDGFRCLREAFRELKAGSGKLFDRIQAGRQVLLERPDCTGRIGIVGFCMGGGFALVLAGTGDYQAASVNYGFLPDDLDDTVAGGCPIVASFGGKDRALPGAADRLERSLERQHVPHDVKEYPGVAHAFLVDYEPKGVVRLMMRFKSAGIAQPGYDPDAPAHASPRLFGFLGERLKTS